MTEKGLTAREAVLAARQVSRSSFVFGSALTVLGVFAVVAPLFAGVVTTFFLGFLMLFGGILESIFAFKAPSFGKGLLTFLFGGLTAVVGLALLAMPERGLGALTFILAAYFVVAGAVDIFLAFQLKPEDGWGWTLFSGVISVLLGVFIVSQWPVSGIWGVGVFIGIKLLVHGWMMMALGITSRDALADTQEQRMEALEAQVQAGAEALREAQLVLAAHMATLLAVGAQLREKVSEQDVDPAIRELNMKLGEAREEVQRLADGTEQALAAGQQEAVRAFKALQRSMGKAAEQLRQRLGIDAL